jgi:hypothetical protein
LGVDFLRVYKLLIDPEGHALLDSTGDGGGWLCTVVPHPGPTLPDQALLEQRPLHPTPPDQPALDQPAPDQFYLHSTAGPASKLGARQVRVAYICLLVEFPALVCASKRLLTVSHYMVHHIITHEPPITSKFRKLDGEKLAAANAELKQLQEDDIIQRSTSKRSWPS